MNTDTMIQDCGSKKLPRSIHPRTIRLVTRLTAKFLAQNSRLWVMSRNDVLIAVLEAVAEKRPLGETAVRKVIWDTLNGKVKNDSKANRVRLVPCQVRNAEDEARRNGLETSTPAQAAYREFLNDFALYSQRSAFRHADRLAVRWVYGKLTKEEKAVCRRYVANRFSVKRAAESVGKSETTYRREEWDPMRDHFRELWKQVDWKKLAEVSSSNPYVFAGGNGCSSYGE